MKTAHYRGVSHTTEIPPTKLTSTEIWLSLLSEDALLERAARTLQNDRNSVFSAFKTGV